MDKEQLEQIFDNNFNYYASDYCSNESGEDVSVMSKERFIKIVSGLLEDNQNKETTNENTDEIFK